MQRRCQPTSTFSSWTSASLALACALIASPVLSQEGVIAAQPKFGTTVADGWALEIHDPETDNSIFVPINSTIKEQMQGVMERIAQAENVPLTFYTLQPDMEVFVYDREGSARLETFDFQDSAITLTPCDAGYCLPPWMFDSVAPSGPPGLIVTDPSVPVVDAASIARFLRPLE